MDRGPTKALRRHLHAGSVRATEGSGNGSVATEGKRQPAARRNGEGVDELVRRVQAGAQTAAEEAERATRRGRPIGTADLSADAATRNPARRRAGRRAVEATLRRGRVQAAGRLGGRGCHRPNRRRRPCAVVGLRGRTPDGHDSERANPGDGGRSRVRRCGSTISTVDRELEALTHRAADQVHPGRRVIKHARVRPQRHHARTTQATSATQSQPVHVASPPTTSSQTPTSTQQPSASSGRSSAGGASSSSGSAHPAGPTNASPLGGIGSCVSGCT